MTRDELMKLGIDLDARGFENFNPDSAEGKALIAYKKKQQQQGIVSDANFIERYQKELEAGKKSGFASMPSPMREIVPKVNAKDLQKEQHRQAEAAHARRVFELDRQRNKKPSVQDFRTEVMKRLGNGFQSTLANEKVIARILQYYSTEYKQTEKGLWLFGGIGTGKTRIALAFSGALEAIGHPFAPKFVDAKTIEREKREDGTDVILKYSQEHWLFDDVGFEDSVKSYGNNVDAIRDILFSIYQKRKYKRPFVTSNLTPEADDPRSILSRYGDRVYSRCCEMFNFVYLGGPDYRQK